MAKVLKISCGTWEHASRDERELSVYRDLGEEVVVMAKGQLGDKYKQTVVDGFDVFLFSTVPFGVCFPWKVNVLLGLFMWTHYVRSFHADVLSCHDIWALLIGWLSTVFIPKAKKPKLIYDSHEFEIGRNKVRSKFKIFCITQLERFLIKRAALTIVVCDSIADEVQRIHGLKERPVVVRSTPEYWETDTDICQENRKKLLQRFDGKVNFLLMFHGNLGNGNGIELILPVLAAEEDIGLVLMGEKTSPEQIALLEKMSKELSIEDRILYLPPVKQTDIWKFAGAVDLEMMLIQPIVRSYYFALPNKFFESVQSLTPMVASDLPEMKGLIDKYQIGLYCDINDSNEILDCVMRMREDKRFYESCKENLKTAKRELGGAEEKKVLIEAYKRMRS